MRAPRRGAPRRRSSPGPTPSSSPLPRAARPPRPPIRPTGPCGDEITAPRVQHWGLTPLLHTVRPMQIEQVTSAEALGPLLDAARAEGRCAIDTEFVWERTYAPGLCLVQIATAERLAVIDPVEGAPLEPVAELMADPAVEKVMHAPSGDLAAFVLHHDVRPRNVFDTQLAAGFAGYGGSPSLERLLEQAVNVRLRHDEGFTDWQRRPLTPVQIEYAADDVRHLLAAAEALRARLADQGRQAWVDEEMAQRYGDGATLVQDPELAWRRVSGRGRLRGEQVSALAASAAWREREARRRDLPASWLIKDATL